MELLEQAIALAEREMLLMEGDSMEGLEESVTLREGLLEKAWEQRAGCDERLYAEKLAELQTLQRELELKAETLRLKLREVMKAEKEMDAVLSRYGNSGGKQKRPYFFSKLS